MTTAHPEEDVVTAGELALGVLDGEALKAALLRRERDPTFAAAVDDWERRFAPFTAETAAVTPPERVWTRIETATFSSVAAPVAANDDSRVRFWRRWAYGASGLAAASLAALIVTATRPEPTPPAPVANGPVRVASVAANGAVALTVGVRDGGLLLKAGEGLRADGRVPYLWLMFPDGSVRWVAVIPTDQVGRLNLAPEVAKLAGEAKSVAISLEPQGVVPALDKPGGPVVGAGELSDL